MACLGTESAVAVDDALGCVQCTRGDEVDDADGKRDDDAASVPPSSAGFTCRAGSVIAKE